MFWLVLIVKYTDCNITADLRLVRHNTAASVLNVLSAAASKNCRDMNYQLQLWQQVLTLISPPAATDSPIEHPVMQLTKLNSVH